MRFKNALAAAIGLSMVASPVLAQSASPLSITRAGPAMQSSANLDENYLLPAVVIIAILAAAILLGKKHSDNLGNPISP